jgi:hypothetical protein
MLHNGKGGGAATANVTGWLDPVLLASKIPGIKTQPNPGNSSIFLGDMDPITRRGILAAQNRYSLETQYEMFKKQMIADEIVKAEDSVTTAVVVSHIHKADDASSTTNKRSREESQSTNGAVSLSTTSSAQQFPPPADVVKIRRVVSSMYHKLVSHLQHFYNNHDSLSIVSFLFFPCSLPSLERTMCLWSSTLAGAQSWTLHNNKILAKRTTVGLDLLSQTYDYVFQKLPDICIVFGTIHNRRCVSTGDTLIVAPYNLFFTITEIMVSDGVIVKEVRVELQGYTVFNFNAANNQLTSAQDHYTRIIADNPLVNSMHILKYMNWNS